MPANESDEDYAKRILARADKYLEQVDEAFILKERGHTARAMPTFRPEEISLGLVLGMGGFGVVNEILKFTLDSSEHGDDGKDTPIDKIMEAGGSDDDEREAPIVEIILGRDNNEKAGVAFGFDDNEHDNNEHDNIDPSNRTEHASNSITPIEGGGGADDDFHYEVGRARHLMARRCIRRGRARYALKRLHSDLTALERARGMIDLAVEAKYLSIVWHPNISKYQVSCWLGLSNCFVLNPLTL